MNYDPASTIDQVKQELQEQVHYFVGEPTKISFAGLYCHATKHVDSHGVSLTKVQWDPSWEIRLSFVTYSDEHPDGVISIGSDVLTMTVFWENEQARKIAADAVNEWMVER